MRGQFKNLPELLPVPNGLKLIVEHFHKENASNGKLKGHKGTQVPYRTVAKLYDPAPRSGLESREDWELLCTAEAICNPIDVPNRKLGYRIARNRVIKLFLQEENR